MSELKPGWKRTKFGEVVCQVKDRVDPTTSGLERYVAGEHMDTDDLRIRRWGEIGVGYLGPAFHARFRSGQVLYGSRRTYLRKVAVPDFDGVCANTTFVLKSANAEALHPELLPFLMQTESFHEHSRRESKGSVNPYVNFSDLTWFEFDLPPMEEQVRLLEALHATVTVEEAVRAARKKLRLVEISAAARYFAKHSGAHVQFCRDLIAAKTLALQTGPFGTVLKAAAYRDKGHPVINPVDMVDGQILVEKSPRVGENDWLRLEKYWMRHGDLLLGRKRHMSNLVFVEPKHDGYVVGSDCIRLRVDASRIDARYFFHLLRSETTQHWLQAQAGGNGTVMPGMNEQILGRLTVHLPPMESQRRIAGEFDELGQSDIALVARQSQVLEVRKALVATLCRRGSQ